jgi:hypothetical protein
LKRKKSFLIHKKRNKEEIKVENWKLIWMSPHMNMNHSIFNTSISGFILAQTIHTLLSQVSFIKWWYHYINIIIYGHDNLLMSNVWMFVEVQQSTTVVSIQGLRCMPCHSSFPTISGTFWWDFKLT